MTARDGDSGHLDASVIVVTHNNAAIVDRCLTSIAAATVTHRCEVIVVDGASRDGTLAAIGARLESPRVIALDRNVGFAKATNVGIEASRGRLLVLVNSDAFPDPASIDRLIDAIDAVPGAGIVGARLRYPSGRGQPSTARFPSLAGGLWVALMLHRAPLLGRAGIGIDAHRSHYRTRRRVDWTTAAFCIARREIGEMPTRSFMYGEDVAWARACAERGMSVWLEPAASAVHVGRASVDQSQPAGFAQRRRVLFELSWFAERWALQALAARGVLALHAVVRIALFAVLRPFARGRDGRLAEHVALLRAAVTTRVPR
jgi:N-acetylglucosaminyl-diphospho-decaprenol L-rhamnosyltransferase